MKYSTEILIRLPRNSVAELFQNTGLLQEWQPGLKSYRLLDGVKGEIGAHSLLIYESRKGDLEMTETITGKRFPEFIQMVYRSHGVYNRVDNRFSAQGVDTTLWKSDNYFRFRGFMMLMAPFMKQAYIHHTLLIMDRFKLFAEKNQNNF
jgi:hypothetical protein